jgi:carbamoyltransferase
MIFIVDVIKDKRDLLGAITHVDGTARIQTVSRESNPTYWNLIDAFRRRTGIPILLNTSFNNNAEPIVDNIEDAIVCYLTTKLDLLVIGNYMVQKASIANRAYLDLVPTVPAHNIVSQISRAISQNTRSIEYEIRNNFAEYKGQEYHAAISQDTFNVLIESDGQQTLKDLFAANHISEAESVATTLAEIVSLWAQRFVQLRPPR